MVGVNPVVLVTRSSETELEMIQRQVRKAEEHVARQREIVSRLPPSGDIAEMARALLAELEESLTHYRTHLTQLQGSS